nr:WRKY [Loropetalum chinense var. rubrum]WGV38257.1 WRKY [Loropetalum chinense var. rubrum]
MEGSEAPPLQPPPPPPHSQFLFTVPSLHASSSLLSPSLLHQNLTPEPQNLPDIDWVSLLSGHSTGPMPENAASVLLRAQNGVDEEKGNYKDKRRGGRIKKASRPRFAFQTRSADDILDDGYRWRKYGQKAVKNSNYPRYAYMCTHHTCNVKKQVQRLSKDTSIVVTTYEGIHNHPCEKLMETLSPLLKQMQFLSRF